MLLESPHSRSHRPLQHKELDTQPTAGCDLVTVSNSGPLFSRGRPVSPRNVHARPKNGRFHRVTAKFDLDLRNSPRYTVKTNERAKYLGQMSFSSNVIVRTHAHTRPNGSTRTTKLVGNNLCELGGVKSGGKEPPLPSNRHHWSNDDCLDGKGENYQVCSVQYCVQQLCTV